MEDLSTVLKKTSLMQFAMLFDLPEQNYISNFYLKQLYPKAKVLNLEKLMEIKRVKVS